MKNEQKITVYFGDFSNDELHHWQYRIKRGKLTCDLILNNGDKVAVIAQSVRVTHFQADEAKEWLQHSIECQQTACQIIDVLTKTNPQTIKEANLELTRLANIEPVKMERVPKKDPNASLME